LREYLRDLLQKQQLPFEVATEAAGAELQLAFVARGVGLGIVSEPMLLRSRHRGSVHVVSVRDIKPRISVCLISRQIPGRLAAPIRCLKDVFTESLQGKG
jgi:DNA-binding transcriptional LysR family regulator